MIVLNVLKTGLEAAVGLAGIALIMVGVVALAEWLVPDADILGHDLPELKPCARCGRVAYRCNLCEVHYERAITSAASRRRGGCNA